MREAEVDRDPSRFLIRQTVGIRAGQRFDQRTLAVIHVTSGGDDEMLRFCHRKTLRTAAIRDEFRLARVICSAERRDNFIVLVCENGSQVELELASFNIPDNGRRMRTQPCSQFLRLEFVVSYFERRGLHDRTRQRAAADLGAASAYCRLKRQPVERRNDLLCAHLQFVVRYVQHCEQGNVIVTRRIVSARLHSGRPVELRK